MACAGTIIFLIVIVGIKSDRIGPYSSIQGPMAHMGPYGPRIISDKSRKINEHRRSTIIIQNQLQEASSNFRGGVLNHVESKQV